MSVSPCNAAPGVAAIPGLTGGGKQQILLFYNTMNSNLGVQLRTGDSGAGSSDSLETTLAPFTTDQVGYIANPTQLGAAQLAGSNVVVGFTASAQSEQKCNCCNNCPCTVPGAPVNHDVSIVSPVYRTLAQTDASNTTIAISSSSQIADITNEDPDAWVYYLDGAGGATKNVMEYRVTKGTKKVLGNVTNVVKGSSLAAYYNKDTTKRYVVYQASNGDDDDDVGELEEHCSDNDSTTHIAACSDSFNGTTLAIVYVSEKKKTYLYYTTTGGKIRRVIKSDGAWEENSVSIKSGSDYAVAPGSQLTAIYSDTKIHLLFVNKAGDWQHWDDAI